MHCQQCGLFKDTLESKSRLGIPYCSGSHCMQINICTCVTPSEYHRTDGSTILSQDASQGHAGHSTCRSPKHNI